MRSGVGEGTFAAVEMELSLSAVRINHGRVAAAPPIAASNRLPVLIGRDPSVTTFAIPDASISRIHASLDVRHGRLCIRDAGSTNGTFTAGRRVPAGGWVDAGPFQSPCEVVVGDWLVTVTGSVAASLPQSKYGNTDGSFFDTIMDSPPTPVEATPMKATVLQPASVVARAYAVMASARFELVKTVANMLEAAPIEDRARLVDEIVRSAPAIVSDPSVREILQRHTPRVLATSFEAAAASSLRELARWYVGGAPPETASDAFAFGRKLKLALDALLGGLVPMFAGLDRFEQQVGGSQGAFGVAKVGRQSPRTPREAARALLDWRDRSDGAVHAIRADVVELTIHQVAVLNGMMRGVKVLLAELAPGTLEQAFQRRLASRGLFGRLLGRLRASPEKWALHEERYRDLADEENERFRLIFGPEFVAEYKQCGFGSR